MKTDDARTSPSASGMNSRFVDTIQSKIVTPSSGM